MEGDGTTRSFLVSYNFVNDLGSGFGDSEMLMTSGKLDYETIVNFREAIGARLNTSSITILNVIELES